MILIIKMKKCKSVNISEENEFYVIDIMHELLVPVRIYVRQCICCPQSLAD